MKHGHLLRFLRTCRNRKVNDVQLFTVFSFMIASSVWYLYKSNYAADYSHWDAILKKRHYLANADKMSHDSLRLGMRPYHELGGSSLMLSLVENGESDLDDSASSATAENDRSDISVRTKLEKSLGNVEENVLDLDVKLLLRTSAPVRAEDNRLVHKLQRALLHPAGKCVIRIGKYCGTRCKHHFGNYSKEWQSFSCTPMITSQCAVETRFIDEINGDIMSTTDILIIIASLHESLRLEDLMAARSPGQLWVLFSRESPQHDPEYAPPQGVYNPYNLSITYSPDSDMYFPYCHTHPEPTSTVVQIPKKTKLMAWMASNCHRLSWNRNELVTELRKHINIDTYGKCGDSGRLAEPQATKTLQQYKFYLALENSECENYVSEKVWRTSLLSGIVPVVYGSKRRDYERILPNNSFIYLEDFGSMAEFADYIRNLESNDALYRKFFEWRENASVFCHQNRAFVMLLPDVNLCYLMKKLLHVHANPETSWQRKFPDFRTWWLGSCSDPSVRKEVMGFDVHRPFRKPKRSPVGNVTRKH